MKKYQREEKTLIDGLRRAQNQSLPLGLVKNFFLAKIIFPLSLLIFFPSILHTVFSIEDEASLFNKTINLKSIDSYSHNETPQSVCATPSKRSKIFPNIHLNMEFAILPKEKANIIIEFLHRLKAKVLNRPEDEKEFMQKIFKKILNNSGHRQDLHIDSIRFLIYFDKIVGKKKHWLFSSNNENRKNSNSKKHFDINIQEIDEEFLKNEYWFHHPIEKNKTNFNVGEEINVGNSGEDDKTFGFWTWPYYLCTEADRKKWIISYTTGDSIYQQNEKYFGELSFDINLTNFSINQCEATKEQESNIYFKETLGYFRGTHKCNLNTTTCEFIVGRGWRLGSYECKCKVGYYAYKPEWNNSITGEIVESCWSSWMLDNKTLRKTFEEISSCTKCLDGCEDCFEAKSCFAPISIIFRLILLSINISCMIASIVILLLVYKYRKMPILKTSSPLFHSIFLYGCIIMYSEMIALFPTLSTASCIAVKWSRHLGFCVAYTALYMKLCRVYLTFRVKSAHKIKLTEKHLLNWMSPIMVIMLLYLFAWTISDPTDVQRMETNDGLRFLQCIYNWWDNSLAIGEVIFLLYGIWISYKIRDNVDARFISFSIYNIALVNILMVSIHLFIFPQAGPDLKYLFAFVRTQLSTTVTIALVFGSKLCAVLRGDKDATTDKEVANSSNGFGQELDLGEENQQLKEELQKMAGQIERLRLAAMAKNNPHLKAHTSRNIITSIVNNTLIVNERLDAPTLES